VEVRKILDTTPGVEPGIAAEKLDDVKLAKLHSLGE
jgi:hypothetical protein